jgi:hypothetical protein
MAVVFPISAAFAGFAAGMNTPAISLVTGFALWSTAGWLSHPRELLDHPVFWVVWLGATLIAGGLGLARRARPLRDTALLFLPILPVLLVTALLTGRGFGLLPLGLIYVAVIALPALGLATLARRLAGARPPEPGA